MPRIPLSRRNLMRGGIVVTAVAGTGAVATAALADSNDAAAPKIIDSAAWKARKPSSASEVLNAKPKYIVVHHTAGSNNVGDSEADAHTAAYDIQGWHMNGNGWNDSGQQFTVSRGGHILEGRIGSLEQIQAGDKYVRGIHAGAPANAESIGIENEGTYTTEQPPDALFSGLTDLCGYIAKQYGIPAAQVFGHRDFMSTQCPGDQLYAKLPQLRTAISVALGGKDAPVWAASREGTRGERVKTVQHLLNQAGIATEADGDFGPTTVKNVKAFQAKNGLVDDGVIGPKTWPKLVVGVKKDSSGDAVKAVQSQLSVNHGIPTEVDGNFGPTTEANVRKFQEQKALEATGKVDAASWQLLIV